MILYPQNDTEWMTRQNTLAELRHSPSRDDLLNRIASYFGNGGLFNPEHMEHEKVRDLMTDCQTYIKHNP